LKAQASGIFCQFCDIAKSGDGLCENLARFGYKQNMKVKFVEHLFFFSFFFYLLATLLETMYKKKYGVDFFILFF